MSLIADHAQRRQEAWVERRRLRLAAAVKQAVEASGYPLTKEGYTFMVRLLELLNLDVK